MARIVQSELVVGMEVHVQLATRTKMFSRALSPAANSAGERHPPNSCIDPVILALPGALPVMNQRAIELAMLVGMALGCRIAPGGTTRWDRKSYFYPDLPKGYQISQYDQPLCAEGALEIPAPAAADSTASTAGGASVVIDESLPPRRIRIIRAHLEEDAGKLLHEAPGGGAIDHSIVDLNRAGAPLLEIVTAPDLRSADECVLFAAALRRIIRFIGVGPGVLERGQIRFEPNINCTLTLDDGRTVRTPIVEVKNLNSFRALRGAVEFEAREQPARFLADGREHGPGAKQTRGWDDRRACTVVQREKEDAHDYRYFPDPDLPPLEIDDAWRRRIGAELPELPGARAARYRSVYGLSAKEAAALTEERAESDFFQECVARAIASGLEEPRAGRWCANLLLQSGAKRANERASAEPHAPAGGLASADEAADSEIEITSGAPPLLSTLGITPEQVGAIAGLREAGKLNAQAADALFGLLCDDPGSPPHDAAAVAAARGLLIVQDDGALDGWCDKAIADNPQAAADVRAGKQAALGRLVGAVMKLAGGRADGNRVREALIAKLGA